MVIGRENVRFQTSKESRYTNGIPPKFLITLVSSWQSLDRHFVAPHVYGLSHFYPASGAMKWLQTWSIHVDNSHEHAPWHYQTVMNGRHRRCLWLYRFQNMGISRVSTFPPRTHQEMFLRRKWWERRKRVWRGWDKQRTLETENAWTRRTGREAADGEKWRPESRRLSRS